MLGAEEMAERKEARGGKRKEDALEGGRDASKEDGIVGAAFDEIVMHVSR